jgi:phosphoribosylglycinamide formyltransferase-1
MDAARESAPYELVVVISNVAGAQALDRARRAGIPAHWVDHRGRPREAFEGDLGRLLREARVDLVCLAGFLRILSPWFVGQFRGRILNIHPSLLPSFGGPGLIGMRVHEAVLAAGRRETGCTIHLVDETVDGGPIVAQVIVPVLSGDTREGLAERVAREEHRLYPQVVRAMAEGRLRVGGRRLIGGRL